MLCHRRYHVDYKLQTTFTPVGKKVEQGICSLYPLCYPWYGLIKESQHHMVIKSSSKRNRPLPFWPPFPLAHMTDAESVLLWGLTKLSGGRGRLNPVNWVIGFLSSSSADLPSLFHGCNPHDRTKIQQLPPTICKHSALAHSTSPKRGNEMNLVGCVQVRASVRGAIFNFPSAIVVGRRPPSAVGAAGTRAERGGERR